MFFWLEKMRNKSVLTRQLMAVGVAGFITLLVFAGWWMNFSGNEDRVAEERSDASGPLSVLSAQVSGGWATVTEQVLELERFLEEFGAGLFADE